MKRHWVRLQLIFEDPNAIVSGGLNWQHIAIITTFSRSVKHWLQLKFFIKLIVSDFLPERDYVTFGSLLSQFRLSVVCRLSVCLSVTLVHPTQGVDPFGKLSSPLCTPAIL